jgi:hypothetical protein
MVWKTALTIAPALILATALMAMDMRVDLSELKSSGWEHKNSATLVAWPQLRERGEISGNVRMLGYMMDEQRPVRDGERVDTFMLMPDAGYFWHPARRTHDQIVIVWSTYPVLFRNRELVWVSGMMDRTIRESGADRPDYAMIFAQVSPAASKEIATWFQP